VLGHNHPKLAVLNNNLANLYKQTGNLSKALEMYTQVALELSLR
jgi:hypothetical protein